MDESTERPPSFLLLLPPTPSPSSFTSLKAAYGETLVQVLKEVASASSESTKAAVLEIALACPTLVDKLQANRSSIYEAAQKLVSTLYKLICVIAASEDINIEDSDGVDARVLIVAWSPDDDCQQASPYGPIITLPALAQSRRAWQYAFGVESEAGEAMVKAFVAAKGSGEDIARVNSGPVMTTSQGSATASDSSRTTTATASGERHLHVAVGGTFDHLHIGHKLLLTMTALAVDEAESNVERSMTVGITGDELLQKKKYAEVLESWAGRQRAVHAFLDSILDFNPSQKESTVSERNDSGANGHSVDITQSNGLTVKYTEISDPFGPTITEEQISALIISGETRAGGKAVNDKRKEKGWAELDVFEVDVLDAEEESSEGEAAEATKTENFASKISSTAIREKIARKLAANS